MMDDYGIFTNVVGTVGSLGAAAGAVALGWRSRASWEPCEEDVSRAPQKVGGLASMVAIGLIWATLRDPNSEDELVAIAVSMGLATVASLLFYGFISGVYVYDHAKIDPTKPTSLPNDQRTIVVKIIGGFWLTAQARQALAKARAAKTSPQHLKDLLAHFGNDVDDVWPRPARALAKQVFVSAYLVLTVCGTVALAATAILIEVSGGG